VIWSSSSCGKEISVASASSSVPTALWLESAATKRSSVHVRRVISPNYRLGIKEARAILRRGLVINQITDGNPKN
jgi:hypothetical protein